MPPKTQPLAIDVQRDGDTAERELDASHTVSLSVCQHDMCLQSHSRVEEILRSLDYHPLVDELWKMNSGQVYLSNAALTSRID
jgi:hypothetical protein